MKLWHIWDGDIISGCEMGSCGSQGSVADFCEHSNETFASIKSIECLCMSN